MNRPAPRWGLFILLPLLATVLSYAVARATASGPPADTPRATTAASFRTQPVTVTTEAPTAPPWRTLGVADALRQIAALNCAFGQPAAIPRLGIGLHSNLSTGTTAAPTCPGQWRTTTTVRQRLSLPHLSSPPPSTTAPPTTLPPTSAAPHATFPPATTPTTSPPTTSPSTTSPPTTAPWRRPPTSTTTTEPNR